MRETELSAKVIKEMRKECFVFNIHGGAYQSAGMPDCLVIKEGKYCWIEWKGPDTKLRALQDIVIKNLRKVGALVLVVRFVDEFTWDVDGEEMKIADWKDGARKLIRRIERSSLHYAS